MSRSDRGPGRGPGSPAGTRGPGGPDDFEEPTDTLVATPSLRHHAHETTDDEFAPEEIAMLRDFFRDEAHDVLERLTARLLATGSRSPDAGAVTEMMRATHTLKGSAGTVGLQELADFCHQFEDQLAQLRNGRLPWSATVMDRMVEVIDALRSYADAVDASTSHHLLAERVRQDLDALAALARPDARAQSPTTGEQDEAAGSAGASAAERPARPVGKRISARETLPAIPALTDAAARAMLEPDGDEGGAEPDHAGDHDARASERQSGAVGGAPDVSDGTPLAPYRREDESTRAIVTGAGLPGAGLVHPTGDPDRLDRVPDTADASWGGSIDTGTLPALDAITNEEFRRDGRTVLRVDPSRIDALMDSVGELVFDRTRIERRVQFLHKLTRDLSRTRQALRDEIRRVQAATSEDERRAIALSLRTIEEELAEGVTQLGRAGAALLEDSEALRRTSTNLQNELTRVRMLSAGALFQRLARALRSIARRAGKRVRLLTTGDDTEFDKTVAEQIADPLIQLLRNAVAHGIEPMVTRTRAGKSPEGTIRIDARQEGGLITLEVSDDGAGIDPDALRRRFVERGRWTEARAALATDEDVLRAIFDAGVSTRDEADYLAGRGVGLDAVRDTIARLGGEVRMASTVGRGTTFTMRLPVSTAVSQALLFKIHGEVFAVPHVHVVETIQVELDGAPPAYVQVRDDPLPLVMLQAAMDERRGLSDDTGVMPAVVVEYAGKKLAFTCDKLVGPREIFVKPLGPLLSPLPLYAGATISGSGKVQLILDPAALVRMAYPGSQPFEAPEFTSESTGVFPITHVAGRALVVDDSRAIRETISRILSRTGYVVDLAEHGEHAWIMLGELDYHVVVTDLEMPELDGLSLIERLRADPRFAPLPVVIVSSRADADTHRRVRELGVHAFVQKPVTEQKLLDAMTGLDLYRDV